MEIFEWDGWLMIVMLLFVEDYVFIDEMGYRILFFEWNGVNKRWVDIGIEILFKIRNKFVEDEEGVEIVVSGNYFVIMGYMWDGSFRIVVYKCKEKYWRFFFMGVFFDKMW